MGEKDKEIRVMLSVLVRVASWSWPANSHAKLIQRVVCIYCCCSCVNGRVCLSDVPVWYSSTTTTATIRIALFFSISFDFKKRNFFPRLVYIFPKYFFFVLDMKTPKPLAVSSCSSITTHRHCCAYHLGTLLVLPCAVYPNTLLAMQMARFVSYTSSHHWLSISAIWISGGDGDEERRPWK